MHTACRAAEVAPRPAEVRPVQEVLIPAVAFCDEHCLERCCAVQSNVDSEVLIRRRAPEGLPDQP